MAGDRRDELRALRRTKFDAVLDAMADKDAGQYDVAKAVTEYGSACFMHGRECAR